MLALLAGCAVFLVLMAGLFAPLEAWWPAHAVRPSLRARVGVALLFGVNTVLMQALGAPLLAWVQQEAVRPSWGRVLLVFIASDLVGYGVHRAMHRVPWLWRFHALHHAATEPTWLDAWKQHPVDFVVHGVAVGLPGALLGVSLSELGSVVLLRKAFTTWLHVNVRWSRGPLWWLLASPQFHRTHHAADPRCFNTHFAGTFPLWDVLFGTLAPAPEIRPEMALESSTR